MTTRFTDLTDAGVLAAATGVAEARIVRYANHPKQTEFYEELRIPKRGKRRSGQFRVVYKAKDEWLSDLHHMIGALIVSNVTFDPCVQGFVHGRSIKTNAQIHLGARILLHGDLTNFFDTITVNHVESVLLDHGTPPTIADVVARCVTIEGALRQGTRCSPAVANLVCKPLDLDLLALTAAHGSRYSRYGDNLTFSGDAVPPSSAVERIVRKHQFVLRDGACWKQVRGFSQYVTGLAINDPAQPRLPRRLKRRLRLVMHKIAQHGIDRHFKRIAHPPRGMADQRSLEGMLLFANSIEKGFATKLREKFRTGIERAKASRPQEPDS